MPCLILAIGTQTSQFIVWIKIPKIVHLWDRWWCYRTSHRILSARWAPETERKKPWIHQTFRKRTSLRATARICPWCRKCKMIVIRKNKGIRVLKFRSLKHFWDNPILALDRISTWTWQMPIIHWGLEINCHLILLRSNRQFACRAPTGWKSPIYLCRVLLNNRVAIESCH